LDLWKTKIDIVASVDQVETRFLPMDWLYKEILGFTEDEIAGLREKLKSDKKFAVELDSITSPDETGQNTVDPFDTTSYQITGGTSLAGLPTSSQSFPSQPGVVLPTPDESNSLSFSLGGSEAPIKDNPQVRIDQRNKERRRSSLEMQADQPDFHRMLHPRKNKSLSDIYDTEFLKNPLTEAIKRDLRIGTTKEAYLSREMRSMLEGFDRRRRAVTNELPVEIHLLKEDENQSSSLDVALDQLLVENNQEQVKLEDIVLEEARESSRIPELTELASLGLDLKDEENKENFSNSAD
jgi:hypothetical protein